MYNMREKKKLLENTKVKKEKNDKKIRQILFVLLINTRQKLFLKSTEDKPQHDVVDLSYMMI